MTHRSAEPTSAPSSPAPTEAQAPVRRGWRTIDVMVTVTIGIAMGIVFMGLNYLYYPLDPLFKTFTPMQGILAGLWFLPAILAGVIVRKPGAALVAEILAACVEMSVSQWGMSTMLSALFQGLGAEIGFAVFAYRRFGFVPAAVAGIGAAVLEWGFEIVYSYGTWALDWKLIYLTIMAASGAVIAALVCVPLAKALAATGVLSSFRIGREHAERTRA